MYLAFSQSGNVQPFGWRLSESKSVPLYDWNQSQFDRVREKKRWCRSNNAFICRHFSNTELNRQPSLANKGWATLISQGWLPVQFRDDCLFNTARITFLGQIKLLSLRPMQCRCLGPPRQIVASLSGKIFNWVLWLPGISSGFLGSGLGENGTSVTSISTTLFLLYDKYELVSWSNSTCANSPCKLHRPDGLSFY